MGRDVSIEWKSVRVAVALGALIALACTSRGDPKPIDIRDFSEARPVNDSLKKLVPVGTPVPRAQAVMAPRADSSATSRGTRRSPSSTGSLAQVRRLWSAGTQIEFFPDSSIAIGQSSTGTTVRAFVM